MIEIVVARYKEKLSWLNKEPFLQTDGELKRTIINKGPEIPHDEATNWNVVNYPNVGRECDSFLNHIIANYENLAPVTVFLPASSMDSIKREKTEKTMNKVFETQSSVFYGQWFTDVARNLYNDTIDDWIGSNTQNQTDTKSSSAVRVARIRPFGRWYRHNFADRIINVVCWNSIFAVAREHILQHTREYYENLLTYLSDHVNPEEGHFLERSWVAVFAPIPEECLYTVKRATHIQRKILSSSSASSASSKPSSMSELLAAFKQSKTPKENESDSSRKRKLEESSCLR